MTSAYLCKKRFLITSTFFTSIASISYKIPFGFNDVLYPTIIYSFKYDIFVVEFVEFLFSESETIVLSLSAATISAACVTSIVFPLSNLLLFILCSQLKVLAFSGLGTFTSHHLLVLLLLFPTSSKL